MSKLTLPIYFDNAATTPMDERVAAIMSRYLTKGGVFGNAASLQHQYGREAKQAVDTARNQVAGLINCQPEEIIWTSGATEANNLAIKGIAHFYQRNGKHIITSSIEHKSVLAACNFLIKQGFEVTFIKPEITGIVSIEKIKQALREDTILVSLQHVNNEIGTIQDIADLGLLCRERGVFLHVDAVQSAGKIPIDTQTMHVNLMSFSAHKVYGAKGIGALYISQQPKIRLTPLLHGGGQEEGLRSGTLPVHQIVAMGAAFQYAKESMSTEIMHISALKEKLWNGLQQLAGIKINGDLVARIPHNLNLCIDGVEGSALLLALQNIALSAGSACNATTIEPSYVLRAIGLSSLEAHNSLRITLGRYNTSAEIEYAIEYIKEKIIWLRELSPIKHSLWPEKCDV